MAIMQNFNLFHFISQILKTEDRNIKGTKRCCPSDLVLAFNVLTCCVLALYLLLYLQAQ